MPDRCVSLLVGQEAGWQGTSCGPLLCYPGYVCTGAVAEARPSTPHTTLSGPGTRRRHSQSTVYRCVRPETAKAFTVSEGNKSATASPGIVSKSSSFRALWILELLLAVKLNRVPEACSSSRHDIWAAPVRGPCNRAVVPVLGHCALGPFEILRC